MRSIAFSMIGLMLVVGLTSCVTPGAVDRTTDLPGVVKLTDVAPIEIFPALMRHYAENSIGVAEIHNEMSRDAEEVRLEFFIPSFMDYPTASVPIARLSAGERATVPLNALLSADILQVTEGTLAQASLTVKYEVDDLLFEESYPLSVRVLDRNSIVWDDDRKAGSFVTPRDPVVMSFARAVAGAVLAAEDPIPHPALAIAVALHEALDVYGISYVLEPGGHGRLEDDTLIDYLQFPRQTLSWRSGDSGDFTVLYNALLESVGIESAFVRFPGLLCSAISLQANPREAIEMGLREGEFVEIDGGAWVPVNAAVRGGGFAAAMLSAVELLNQHNPNGDAMIITVRDAWQMFPPAALPGPEPDMAMPSIEIVIERYAEQIQLVVDR